MSKENPLSHHEQLRYDYLFKNIHYLNEREKKEFAYLQGKLNMASGSEASPEIHSENHDMEESFMEPINQSPLPSYGNRSRAKKYQKSHSLPKVKSKKRKIRWGRIFAGLLALLACVGFGMIFMFLKGYSNADPTKPANAKAAQVEVFHGQDTKDGVNILIMGLNVGGSDKKIKLASFMRDNLVYIDGYSQVINGRKQSDNKLNVAYELGEQEGQKGAEMVRKVLKDNFDLDIKYYALVDFQAFATAIDTLFPDGVTIDAKFSTLEGQPLTEATVGDDLHATETESPTQTIKVGKQQMNGSTLLNYARFRDDDEGDYGRTKRQQQVLTAVLQQLKDPTKLFTGSEALGKVFGMTSTNVPYSFLLTNGLSFLDGAQNGIERLTVPELGDWVDAYDVYGGQALLVDQNKYQTKLSQMGMR